MCTFLHIFLDIDAIKIHRCAIKRAGICKISIFNWIRYFFHRNLNHPYCSLGCSSASEKLNHGKICSGSGATAAAMWQKSQEIIKMAQNCHIAAAVAPDPLYIFPLFNFADLLKHLGLQYGWFKFLWKKYLIDLKIDLSQVPGRLMAHQRDLMVVYIYSRSTKVLASGVSGHFIEHFILFVLFGFFYSL